MDRRGFLFDWLGRQTKPAPIGAEHFLKIDLAGRTAEIVTRNGALAAEIRRYFAQYLTTSPGDLVLFAEPMENPEIQGLWEDADPEFECRGDLVVQRDFAARKFGREVVARLNGEELSDSLLNLLRWATPELILPAGALLVHGASVVREGRGYLFFGHSGAGKSTTVRLIAESDPRAQVLGDDAAIVQATSGGLFLHAAPLGSAYSDVAPPRRTVPLDGIFSLEQGSSDFLEDLTASEELSAFLASTMMSPFDGFSSERMAVAARFAGGKIRRLHFRKGPQFWPLILSTYAGRGAGRPADLEEGCSHV